MEEVIGRGVRGGDREGCGGGDREGVVEVIGRGVVVEVIGRVWWRR